MTNAYHAYGLTLSSEFELPELTPISPDTLLPADLVMIISGEVSADGLTNPTTKGLFYQMTEQTLWLNIPSVARFLIANGTQITVCAAPGIDEDSVREYLFSVCLGVIMLQRGYFVLQSSAIRVGEHCFAIAGHSGAGKSTLAAAFLNRGYALLADEFVAVSPQGMVSPGIPVLKLWLDAAHHLNVDIKPLKPIRPRIRKFILPLGTQFCAEPLPLKAMYILGDGMQDDYSYDAITGVKKIACLDNQVYRRMYLSGLELQKQTALLSAKAASQLAMTSITRPHEAFKLAECVNFIEQDLTARGYCNGQ